MPRSPELVKTCHNMNIIVQTTGGDESSLNGERKRPNNTPDNIKRALLMKSIHKKELFCLSYQYAIWISCQTVNILHCDVPYFL